MNLKQTLLLFEAYDISYLHIDVMDGDFVQNYALGVDFCSKLRAATNIPLDIHLMINCPELKLDWFNFQPGEYVSIHWESTPHVQRALAIIRDYGAKPMIALNPATPAHVLENIIDDIDGVLVMTVNPGFSGQKLVPSTLQKIKQIREFLNQNNREDIDIEVDGNVSFENIIKMKTAGANIFVGGTSSIFSKTANLEDNIKKTLQLVNE
jgi:ribulose-phosphate 3-epimerase